MLKPLMSANCESRNMWAQLAINSTSSRALSAFSPVLDFSLTTRLQQFPPRHRGPLSAKNAAQADGRQYRINHQFFDEYR